MKKKIVVIHTGGTISMTTNNLTGAVIPGDTNPLNADIDKLSKYAEIIENKHLTCHLLTFQMLIELQVLA
jgi:L-asparaginase/Glu-tRNA(Gln) amidotransferase subunit D